MRQPAPRRRHPASRHLASPAARQRGAKRRARAAQRTAPASRRCPRQPRAQARRTWTSCWPSSTCKSRCAHPLRSLARWQALHPPVISRAPKVAARRQSTHTVTAGLSRWPQAGTPPTLCQPGSHDGHTQAIYPHSDRQALRDCRTQAVAALAAPAAPALPPLLAVDPKRLRADAELERMFGRRALGAEDREEGQGARLHHGIITTVLRP